jgi:hypothetical protein
MPDRDFVVFYLDGREMRGLRFFSAEHPRYVRDCVRELQMAGVPDGDIFVIRGRRLLIRPRTLSDPDWPDGA